MNRTRFCAVALVLLPTTLLLLTGCGDKEPPASTSGYYDGPMKPKGTSAGAQGGGGPEKKSDGGV